MKGYPVRPDLSLRNLVRAAVTLADLLAVPDNDPYTKTDEYLKRFMCADENLREASVEYANGLPDHDRRRLAR